ncbi:MAG: hypothetical protein FWG40_07635 [Peptococcaceae bacterium]|nr:hypothetical protein [Peptococcaceae bacterium]
MYIEYDEYELIELFESEPTPILQKEAGMFIYGKNDNNGIRLTLSMSIYEMECSIGISVGEHVVFETTLKNVESMRSKDKCLRIHQKESTQDYLIYFGATIFVKIEEV